MLTIFFSGGGGRDGITGLLKRMPTTIAHDNKWYKWFCPIRNRMRQNQRNQSLNIIYRKINNCTFWKQLCLFNLVSNLFNVNVTGVVIGCFPVHINSRKQRGAKSLWQGC